MLRTWQDDYLIIVNTLVCTIVCIVFCTHFVHRHNSFPFLTGIVLEVLPLQECCMVLLVACYQLPTSTPHHIPQLWRPQWHCRRTLMGLFLQRQIPDCRVHKKKYTNIKKYFSQAFSMRLEVLNSEWWRFQLSVMWHCMDWHHTYIPMYIVLYTRRLKYWPFSMFITPTFESSFYSGFQTCLDLVSQKDKSLFKPRCLLERFYYTISHSSS